MNLPKAPESLIRQILTDAGLLTPAEPCALLGVRAYFRDSMGKPGVNDVGTYDDALFFCAPGRFIPANFNTDPSREGWNPGVGKPYAMLQPGTWWFRRGPHKSIPRALRQCTDEEAEQLGIPNEGHFTVMRTWGAGDPRNFVETDYFAINIHPGGLNGTSSWGCQTIPRPQYGIMDDIWNVTRRIGQNRIPYHLVIGPIT